MRFLIETGGDSPAHSPYPHMSTVTAKLRTCARAQRVLLAACVVAGLVLPISAHARPYTVVACDSAAAFGYSTAAWTPFGEPSHAYATCPSAGGFTAGSRCASRPAEPHAATTA